MSQYSNSKSYDSIVAGKYLLALAHSKEKILKAPQVQKLLYIAYGYFLSKKERVLIIENPKAWPFGPVFPRTRENINYSEAISLDSPEFATIKNDKEVTDFFNLLIDKYSKFTGSQLSEWSHAKDGPWDLTVKKEGFVWDNTIDNMLIKDYFSSIKV